MVLVMTVNPGFGGQKFISSMLDKIAAVRRMLDSTGRKILLEVDGGATLENAALIKNAGADILVGGASVFKSADYGAAIKGLKTAVSK
jgi:ribulose-phosphate 3-epimerase